MDHSIPFSPGRRSIPAAAGVGLRSPHHEVMLTERPPVGWLEVHSENFFSRGGAHIEQLERLRAQYPISLHGVGLSLGSTDPIDRTHLENLKRIVAQFEPALVSEHLSWSSVEGRFANDLLPMPYTEEAVRHLAARIDQVQNELGRQILIENVSSYLQFASSTLSESEFVASVVAESRCALLLDLNNIYVAAFNHEFDPFDYLAALPAAAIAEIHLAGHTRVHFGGRDMLIDTHSTHVCVEVWSLYGAAIQQFGGIPTLIEWDSELPDLAVLVAEAQRAVRCVLTRLDFRESIVLRDIQRQFMRGVLDGHEVAGILRPSALSIYANNARVGFTQTLQRTYPAVVRLVGADYFSQCAHDYQNLCPSRRGDLQYVGEHFAAYLSTRHGADEYSFLADVAALEWAYQEAMIEPERPALDVNRLGAVAPQSYPQLRFLLQPSTHLVFSRFPILAIWQANVTTEDAASAARIDLASGSDRLLVVRTSGQVRVHRLTQGEFTFLTRLLARDIFGEAVEAASEADRTFDPGASLQRFVVLRTIVDFYL